MDIRVDSLSLGQNVSSLSRIQVLLSHCKLLDLKTKSLVLQRTERLQILPFSYKLSYIVKNPSLSKSFNSQGT